MWPNHFNLCASLTFTIFIHFSVFQVHICSLPQISIFCSQWTINLPQSIFHLFEIPPLAYVTTWLLVFVLHLCLAVFSRYMLWEELVCSLNIVSQYKFEFTTDVLVLIANQEFLLILTNSHHKIYFIRSHNVKFPKADKLWVSFQLVTWFENLLEGFTKLPGLLTLSL